MLVHEPIAKAPTPQPTAPAPIPTLTVSTKSAVKPIPVPPPGAQPEPLPLAAERQDQGNTREGSGGVSDSPVADSMKLAPQIAAMARKEQAFRQREQLLKQEKKALEEKLAEAQQFSELKTKFGSKDFSEAEKLGLTYEDYTQYLLGKGQEDTEQSRAFKALEAEVQALKKGKEESAAREFDDTVAEYKNEISRLVLKSEDFPRIKKAGKEDAVLQTILDSWEIDNEELGVEESARLVEEYLKGVALSLALDEAKAPDAPRKLPPPRPGTHTLNQTMAAVGTSPQLQKSLSQLSESERYAEARRRVLERQLKG